MNQQHQHQPTTTKKYTFYYVTILTNKSQILNLCFLKHKKIYIYFFHLLFFKKKTPPTPDPKTLNIHHKHRSSHLLLKKTWHKIDDFRAHAMTVEDAVNITMINNTKNSFFSSLLFLWEMWNYNFINSEKYFLFILFFLPPHQFYYLLSSHPHIYP